MDSSFIQIKHHSIILCGSLLNANKCSPQYKCSLMSGMPFCNTQTHSLCLSLWPSYEGFYALSPLLGYEPFELSSNIERTLVKFCGGWGWGYTKREREEHEKFQLYPASKQNYYHLLQKERQSNTKCHRYESNKIIQYKRLTRTQWQRNKTSYWINLLMSKL
jgi:hypothetical protein